jgi:hypothetical protein
LHDKKIEKLADGRWRVTVHITVPKSIKKLDPEYYESQIILVGAGMGGHVRLLGGSEQFLRPLSVADEYRIDTDTSLKEEGFKVKEDSRSIQIQFAIPNNFAKSNPARHDQPKPVIRRYVTETGARVLNIEVQVARNLAHRGNGKVEISLLENDYRFYFKATAMFPGEDGSVRIVRFRNPSNLFPSTVMTKGKPDVEADIYEGKITVILPLTA